jgi:WD40 repeat protein
VDVRLRALVLARAIHSRYWGQVRAMGLGAPLTTAPPFGGYWFNRVQLSRDGKYAVTAGGALILFDVATGREVKRVLEVGGARRALALAKDGKHVLTGHTNDATFHLLELPSLRTVQTFKGHTRGLEALALSPDGTLAASAGVDGTLRLWDVRKGTEQARLAGFSGAPRSLAFSSDGKRLLLGSTYRVGDKPIWLFDVEKRQALWASKGPTEAVIGVAFLPGDREVVSASANGDLILWDLKAGKVLSRMNHGATLHDLAVSPDGKRALTAGFGDRKVKLWELETGRLVESFDGHVSAVLGVGFSADGKQAVSCDAVACVRVWKLGR